MKNEAGCRFITNPYELSVLLDASERSDSGELAEPGKVGMVEESAQRAASRLRQLGALPAYMIDIEDNSSPESEGADVIPLKPSSPD